MSLWPVRSIAEKPCCSSATLLASKGSRMKTVVEVKQKRHSSFDVEKAGMWHVRMLSGNADMRQRLAFIA
jgi:hypothetical protein